MSAPKSQAQSNTTPQEVTRGLSPVLAIAAAIGVSLSVLALGYYVFNRSEAAVAARAASKQLFEERRQQALLEKETEANSEKPVDDSVIDKEIENIEQSLKSANDNANQISPDDISDQGLQL